MKGVKVMSTSNVDLDQNIKFAPWSTRPAPTCAAPAPGPPWPYHSLYCLFANKPRGYGGKSNTFLCKESHFTSFCSPSQLRSGSICSSLHMSGKPLKEQQDDHSNTLSEPDPSRATGQGSAPRSVHKQSDVATNAKTSRLLKEMQNHLPKKKKNHFCLAHVLVFLPCFCAKFYGNATKLL